MQRQYDKAISIVCQGENLNQDQLLSRKEAAKYLGKISAGTLAVWDCTKRYDLKPIKVGRHVRYKKSVLDEWLRERTRP